MKSPTSIFKSRTAMRLLAITLSVVLLLPGGAVWAGLQPPLSKIPVPVPTKQAELAQFPELAQFVQDVPAAIRLGKALFWDTQVGSDGAVACATCHYKAGADPITVRSRNQLHPRSDGQFLRDAITKTVIAGNGLADQDLAPLASSIFPFFQISPVTGRVGDDTFIVPPATAATATITRNVDDTVGSQGIRLSDFTGLVNGSAIDSAVSTTLDPVFNAGGANVQRVTGRNAPSVINAVFNFANFWDGRANNIFNGVNPFGPLDQSARIWVNSAGIQQVQIAIPNASLASQAVGPPLSDVEMSGRGRTFRDLGRKMINNGLIPLGQQLVHPDDSVLGALSNAPANGLLNTTYGAMIQSAFRPEYWNGGNVPDGSGFSQIEANFSLFWGLSIMLYEATLVSDRTPFDRFQLGNKNTLSVGAQFGLATFDSKCAVCHSGPELSDAVIGSNVAPNCTTPDCGNPVSFTSNTNHRLILLNQTSVPGAKSDTGFFNISVRPTAEDLGRGGTAPFLNPLSLPTPANFPLSFSRLAELQAQGQLPFDTPVLPPFALTTDVVQGSFKTPGLRNIELNPPYFHNGSALSLLDVVEFYARGGNFPKNIFNLTGNPEHAAATLPMGKIRGGGTERDELVQFLQSLTDERVRLEKAPFDHPELVISNGTGTSITLLATGGSITPVQVGLITLNNPFTAPTISTLPTIGGLVSNRDVTVAVAVGGGVPPTGATHAATVINNTWSLTLTGLSLGNHDFTVRATSPTGDESNPLLASSVYLLPTAFIFGGPPGATKLTSASMTVGAIDTAGRAVHFYKFKLDNGAYSGDVSVDTPLIVSNLSDTTHTVSVIVRDSLGNQQPDTSPTTVSWRVKATPPVVSVNPIPLPTRETSLTLSGTISELGTIPRVSNGTGAECTGTVTDIPGSNTETWSCQISGLKKGTNNITVTATDIAQNVGSATTSVNIILPDGCFRGTAAPDVSDAVKALRIAVGTIVEPSLADKLHGDVAPLVNGVPAPDGTIGSEDALIILKKVAGLVNF